MPYTQTDAYGVPTYPIRQMVNITVNHGAIGDYTHVFKLSYNCDENKQPLGKFYLNCDWSEVYASTSENFVSDVYLRYNGTYRMQIGVVYPGQEPITAVQKISVLPVPQFPLIVEQLNNNDGNSIKSTFTSFTNSKDIRTLDFRFTAAHVAMGSWHIRWYINGAEVQPHTIDAPLETNEETRFASPGIFEVKAVLDDSWNDATEQFEHTYLRFESLPVELTVKSAVGVRDVRIPLSGWINEPFPDIVIEIDDPREKTCFEVEVTDPDDIRLQLSFGTDVTRSPCTSTSYKILNLAPEQTLPFGDDFKFNKLGKWAVKVTTRVALLNNFMQEEIIEEVAERTVDIRCRPCNRPTVSLIDSTGEGSSTNRSRKFPR